MQAEDELVALLVLKAHETHVTILFVSGVVSIAALSEHFHAKLVVIYDSITIFVGHLHYSVDILKTQPN